jgi:anoctamin-10
LIRALAEVGLTTEVRNGDGTSLLVFIKAADENILADVVHRSRLRDWLHGVRQIQPVKDAATTLTKEPLTDAERHRQIHHMITGLREDGGAAICPKSGDWKNVDAIFPLHDHVKNKKWLTEFSRKTFLTPEDLDDVKDTVGEKVSYTQIPEEA